MGLVVKHIRRQTVDDVFIDNQPFRILRLFHEKRRRFVFKRLLEYVGIEPERFQVRWISGSEGQKFSENAIKLSEDIRALGPNRKLRDVR